MDVKSRIISKIDSLLSEYEGKKDSDDVKRGGEETLYRVLGAIEALKRLRNQVKSIDIDRHKTIRIVEVSHRDPRSFTGFPSFLNEVLCWTEEIPKRKLLGDNPKSTPGRREACKRIRQYVFELDNELAGN